MADPLSVTASVLAITTAFLQASKGLYDFVSTIKDAPGQVASVAQDTYSFQSSVASIAQSLQRPGVGALVLRDPGIKEAIYIENSLGGCTKAVNRLLDALRDTSTTHGRRPHFYDKYQAQYDRAFWCGVATQAVDALPAAPDLRCVIEVSLMHRRRCDFVDHVDL